MSDFDNGASGESCNARAIHEKGNGEGGKAAEDASRNGGKRRSDAGGIRHHSRGCILDDLFEDENDDKSDIEFDAEMERFFRGLCRVEEHVARATDRLFGALMSRSMGRANFVAVAAALLICTRVIGAVLVEVSSSSELSALAFTVAIVLLVVCAASKRCPANALSAVVIACLPALIEIVTTCAVRGSDADVFEGILNGAMLGVGAGAVLTVVSSLVSDCEGEDVLRTRMLAGPLWGAAIGATVAFLWGVAPFIAREIAFGVDPLYVRSMGLVV